MQRTTCQQQPLHQSVSATPVLTLPWNTAMCSADRPQPLWRSTKRVTHALPS